jgi:hypothetical protein
MCCSPLLSGTILRKCTSRNMEHLHILSFPFVRGLTAISVVGGLGVEDQPSGLPEVSIFLRVIYFFFRGGGGRRKKGTCPDRNQDRRMNWNNKSEPFAAVSLDLFRNAWTLRLPDCRSVCKIPGPKLKSDNEWQCRMCNNIAIRSADSGTEHIFLHIKYRKKNSLLCLSFTMLKADFHPLCLLHRLLGYGLPWGRRKDSWVTRENSKRDENLRRTSLYMALRILGNLSSRIFLQIEA